ncbi:MAG TPA: dynamin family protein [Chthoniobacterales bacterium]
MPPRILTYELQQQYEALRLLLQRALWLSERCADFEATQLLRTRLTNFQAPALLVIVGEVKAGKSSFINAVLREEVCEVAPGPCTTRIQELVYGPERSLTSLGESWERVHLPQEVLREATIVDTPGTNSIVQNHQAITENYLPQSDLVVFVFSAVNPHTKSAWQLLTNIKKDWHRKIVFVLQQADRASAEELGTNREHVRQYARECEVESPTIFTLSAKFEQEGRIGSGYAQFRDYLRSAIEGGEVWRMKVQGSYETIRTLMRKLLTSLGAEKDVVAEERAFYQELLRDLEAREANAGALKQLVVQKLASTYDAVAKESESEFAESLGVGKLLVGALPFLRDKEDDSWLGDAHAQFQTSLRRALDQQARQLSKQVLTELQGIIDQLSQRVSARQDRIREYVAFPETGERLKLVDGLRSRLQRIAVNRQAMSSSVLEEKPEVSRFTIAGAGLGVLGLAILIFARSFWLDVVGAGFVACALVLLVSGLFARRVAMVRELSEDIGASRADFQKRLDAEVTELFEQLFYRVRQALTESIFRLDLRTSHLASPAQEAFAIGEAASELLSAFERGVVPRVSNYA